MRKGMLIIFVSYIDMNEPQTRGPIVGHIEEAVFQLCDVAIGARDLLKAIQRPLRIGGPPHPAICLSEIEQSLVLRNPKSGCPFQFGHGFRRLVAPEARMPSAR